MVGYTLIEILVVLSMVSILSTSSFMFARTFIQSNNQSTLANRLAGALNLTRMEAIRRSEPVIFCGSSDLVHCDGNWQEGQLIKVKNQILYAFYGAPGDYLAWKSNFGKNHQLEFTALGFTKGQQGSFYTYRDQEEGYRIVVFHTGAIRVEKLGLIKKTPLLWLCIDSDA